MKNKLIKLAGSGLGLGYLPKAPGTWGTLLGIPLAYVFYSLGELAYLGLTLLTLGFSISVASLFHQLEGTEDSKHFVLDEVVGFLITVVWLPLTWQTVLAGFILFRLFDALKPGPIGWLDRKVKGALGVILDDVAAGLVASLILQVLYHQTTWLGVRWIA